MDIPEDVMEAARAVYLDGCLYGYTDQQFIDAIARAIMAERERCKKIAETYAANLDKTMTRNEYECGEKHAALQISYAIEEAKQ